MKDWNTWYNFTHEELLLKHGTRIESHIQLLEVFLEKAHELDDKDGMLILNDQISTLMQIVTLNSLSDLIIQFQNELRIQFETSEEQISKLTNMLTPLEPFLPILQEFAEEKRKEEKEKAKWK